MRILLLFILTVCSFPVFGQLTPKQLHKKVNEFIFSNPETAAAYANKELKLAEAGTTDRVIAEIDVAKCDYYADNYDLGEKRLFNAMKNAKELKFDEGIAWASFHIGDLRILEGKYGTAIQYLNNAYDLFVKLECKEGEALSLNAIGLIYLDQEDFQKAQTFFKRALQTGDNITHGDSYTNLAELYLQMEAYSKAQHYANLALKQAIKNDDYYLKSTSLDVLGAVLFVRNELAQAEEYFRQSIEIKEHLLDQKGASATYLKLSGIKQKMDQPDLAFEYMMKAYHMADEVGASQEIRDASFAISKYYARRGLYDSAFFYQNRFVELNEGLMDEQVQKKIAQIEGEKTKRENELKYARLENQKRLEEETTSFYLLLAIGGLVILLGALYLFYYRYKVKKRSFESLEQKNKVIENQNQNILESIRYAQRLQEAILPDAKVLKNAFKSIFTIYLPKDIVAGDFYWFEENENFRILACCDSTGHGVPGAMVSVVCSNALNTAVVELELNDPGKILDATRNKVIESFNKATSQPKNVKDGMDITLISQNKKTGEIHFAGAHHTLWVYRKSTREFEFYKGDKQPIGMYEMNLNYQSQLVIAEPGDRIYMFTDGYADQFGGKDQKKLKSANVKRFLHEISDYSMLEQQAELEKYFNNWKGEEEQVDDVTVIGFEIE